MKKDLSPMDSSVINFGVSRRLSRQAPARIAPLTVPCPFLMPGGAAAV
jgi:hypothetical protein